MSTFLWFPEPTDLEAAASLGGLWRCLFGEVARVASAPISRVACGASALVASGGHPTKDLGLPRFIGRPSSATLANPVIAEC